MTKTEQKLFYQKLGECIRKARLKAELKQEAFATSLNLSRASIVNIEKGRQHPPIHLLWVIAKILNIEVNVLLPDFTASDSSKSEWKKIITKEVKGNKQAKEKILGFLEEVQLSKINDHAK